MRKKLVGSLLVVLLVTAAIVGVAAASDGSIFAKHVHEMGGPNQACTDCHDGNKADEPEPLRGRYARMGGPNKDCSIDYCHNGDKAPLLPMPPGYDTCADCHD